MRLAARIQRVDEPYESGRISGVIVWSDSSMTKYRVIYSERVKDEWIRFDHKSGEPSHAHLRTRTPLRSFEAMKRDLEFLVSKLQELRIYFRR